MEKERTSQIDRVIGLFAVIMGGILIPFTSQLDLGRLKLPGPGAWPFLLSIGLLLLGGWLFFHPSASNEDMVSLPPRWGKFVMALVSLLGYALFLDSLGYLVDTALLLLVQLRWVEGRNWKVSIITALIAAVVSFTVFVFWLDVSLPPGIMPIRAK